MSYSQVDDWVLGRPDPKFDAPPARKRSKRKRKALAKAKGKGGHKGRSSARYDRYAGDRR